MSRNSRQAKTSALPTMPETCNTESRDHSPPPEPEQNHEQNLLTHHLHLLLANSQHYLRRHLQLCCSLRLVEQEELKVFTHIQHLVLVCSQAGKWGVRTSAGSPINPILGSCSEHVGGA